MLTTPKLRHIFFLAILAGLFLPASALGQAALGRAPFRVGEKITYEVAIEHLDNAAYAETHVVSSGRLGDQDAVEVRSRFKTLSLASAAFFLVDEVTTTFVSPVTGLPIYSRREDLSSGLPKATTRDHQSVPAAAHDINTLIYAIRGAGQGSFSFQFGDRLYAVTTQPAGAETVRTAAGAFETVGLSIQSEFLSERGITDLHMQLSNDDARVPVAVRFKTAKGAVRAIAASVQLILPEPEAVPVPVADPVEIPRPTPAPIPTIVPYVDNQPLSAELPFALGENLEYRITTGGREVGGLTLRAESRNQLNGADTLVLYAGFTGGPAGESVFRTGDFIRAWVDPESLVSRQFQIRFSSAPGQMSQTAVFDQLTSRVAVAGQPPVDAPVGTHSVLSLIYAMRSFNLKQSRDNTNPTNDTRVAVFWDDRATVFSLRPSPVEMLEVGGVKVPAQPVNITTNNPRLDPFTPKVWLSNTPRRTPLKMSIGPYVVELVSETLIPLR